MAQVKGLKIPPGKRVSGTRIDGTDGYPWALCLHCKEWHAWDLNKSLTDLAKLCERNTVVFEVLKRLGAK